MAECRLRGGSSVSSTDRHPVRAWRQTSRWMIGFQSRGAACVDIVSNGWIRRCYGCGGDRRTRRKILLTCNIKIAFFDEPDPSIKPAHEAMRGGMLSARAGRRKCSNRQEWSQCVPATSARARGTYLASALIVRHRIHQCMKARLPFSMRKL